MVGVKVEEKTAPVEVRMTEPGATIRGRVVDVAGRPVAKVLVVADTWRERRTLEFRTHTDDEGRFAWRDAPRDVVLFDVLQKGYMASRGVPLTASDREQTVVLHPKLVLNGKVTDAATGRPLPSFRVVQGRPILGESPRKINWSEDAAAEGAGGRYSTEFDEPSEALYIRIEAPGYRLAESRGFRPDDGAQTLDFALEPAKGVSGLVKLPDGTPAEGVEVALATRQHQVSLQGGRIDADANVPRVKTAADGRFAFAAPDGDFLLIAVADAGFVNASPDELARSGVLTLVPWGHIEGGVRIGARTGAGQEVTFLPIRPRREGGPSVFSYGYVTRTDDRGRFAFDRVIAGPGTVSRVVVTELGGGGEQHTPGWPERIDVPPGGTAEVKIGGKGRPVVGQVGFDGTPEFPVQLDAPRARGAGRRARPGRDLAGSVVSRRGEPRRGRAVPH